MILKYCASLPALGLALILICTATVAQAATYQTTINYVLALGNPANGNKIVLDWATDKTNGTVREYDLSYLRFTLYGNGDNELFVDTAIVDSIMQPLAGMTRPLLFLFYDIADLDSLGAFDNTKQNNGSLPGETYNVRGTANGSATGYFLNGIYDHTKSTSGFNLSIETTRISAVPLPAALPLYGAGLAVLGLMGWRKRRQQSAAALATA